MTNLHL